MEGDMVLMPQNPQYVFSLSLISDITRVETVTCTQIGWTRKDSRGQTIFKRHPLNFVLTWHFSLVMGFCVKPLLEALVFTGNSSTPQSSLKRYIKTYLYLAEWHLCGDMFDSKSRAFQSVQTVRKIHDTVRGNMEKSMPKQKWMTQYDMCLVRGVRAWSSRMSLFRVSVVSLTLQEYHSYRSFKLCKKIIRKSMHTRL